MKLIMMPEVLLTCVWIAVILMLVAMTSWALFFRIAQKAMAHIFKQDRELFDQIFPGREGSWEERGYHPFKETGLWSALYKYIYKGGRIDNIIDERVSTRAARLYKISSICFVASVFVMIIVVSVGFYIVNFK